MMLSLGGSYILIKSFSESLPIYWQDLAHIPLSVLTKIRQLIFSFLWSDHKKRNRYNLCKWELVSKPKLYGGWGLRNIYIFYRVSGIKNLMESLDKTGHLEQGDKRQIFSL
jgi:hypothetical protein